MNWICCVIWQLVPLISDRTFSLHFKNLIVKSCDFSISTDLGTSLLLLLLAGYLAQKYGLPPPPPKIAAIDLGTTFSSIGIYQAVTGATDIIADETGRQSIPSVVAFL